MRSRRGLAVNWRKDPLHMRDLDGAEGAEIMELSSAKPVVSP